MKDFALSSLSWGSFPTFLQPFKHPLNGSTRLWPVSHSSQISICKLAQVHSAPSSRSLMNSPGHSIDPLDIPAPWGGYATSYLLLLLFPNLSNTEENKVRWRGYVHSPSFPSSSCFHHQQKGRGVRGRRKPVRAMQTEEPKLLALVLLGSYSYWLC